MKICSLFGKNTQNKKLLPSVLLAVRICGRPTAEIAGSNPAVGMDVYLV